MQEIISFKAHRNSVAKWFSLHKKYPVYEYQFGVLRELNFYVLG